MEGATCGRIVSAQGMTVKAIDECKKIMPKVISKECRKCFNNIINGVAKIDAQLKKALMNYLFMGEVDATGDIANDYCQFVLDLASGLEVDESFMVDGCSFNSRGGKGISVR